MSASSLSQHLQLQGGNPPPPPKKKKKKTPRSTAPFYSGITGTIADTKGMRQEHQFS